MVPMTFLPSGAFFLTFGFWAGGAAGAFRKIAETRNEDVWNLMNALGSLKNMFALLRFLVIAALVLLVVGVLLVVFVVIAPDGILGWVKSWKRSSK